MVTSGLSAFPHGLPSSPPGSFEYWFHCMDLDGDGVLSAFELKFYEEQSHWLQT